MLIINKRLFYIDLALFSLLHPLVYIHLVGLCKAVLCLIHLPFGNKGMLRATTWMDENMNYLSKAFLSPHGNSIYTHTHEQNLQNSMDSE